MPKFTVPRKKHRSKDGRPQFRTDSRQAGNTTQFSTRGDDTAIGNGQSTFFDFSNAVRPIANMAHGGKSF